MLDSWERGRPGPGEGTTDMATRKHRPTLGIVELAVDPADVDQETYPVTGERYSDVVVLWVASEGDKQALLQDERLPFFTTAHFDGHPSVLVRASRVAEMDRDELVEIVEEAWLAQASDRRGRAWLASRGLAP